MLPRGARAACAGGRDQGVTVGLETGAELRAALTRLTPPGTPMTAARAAMERAGFWCRAPSEAPFAGRELPFRYMYCRKQDELNWFVSRIWQTTHADSAGVVGEILATEFLEAP